jgi:hypothetical protein
MSLAQKIERAFARHPALRLLFFFDPEGRSAEEFEALVPTGYRCEHVAGSFFATKARLAREWREERVVLYLPCARPQTQEEKHAFPLMGEWVAGRTLEVDEVGDFLERYDLADAHRPLIARWISELRLKHVQETCSEVLRSPELNEERLLRGLVAAFLDFKHPEEWSVLAARMVVLFEADPEKKWGSFAGRMDGLELVPFLKEQLGWATGVPLGGVDVPAFRRWVEALHYNRIVLGLQRSEADPYVALKLADYASETRFRQFLQQLERHGLWARFVGALDAVGTAIHGEILLTAYGSNAAFHAMPGSMFWQFAERQLRMLSERPQEVRSTLRAGKSQPEPGTSQAAMFDFLVHAADLLCAVPAGGEAYVLDTPAAYVDRYTREWCQLDRGYREALIAYRAVDFTPTPDATHEAAQAALTLVQTAYDSHVDGMNREWLKCLSECGFEYARLGIPRQSDFFATHVAESPTKVAVLISDAFRYEAAQELLESLHEDPKNAAVLGHALASIPSRTRMGMALLLPGAKQWVNGALLASDLSTESPHREAVLRRTVADAATVQAKDLGGLSKAEQRELFKHDVVYVYHDTIDAIGDRHASEHRTLEQVRVAVEELHRLVRLLHGSLNVRRVLVTADHGFLYTDKGLEEALLERVPVEQPLEQKNRFFLTEQQVDLKPLGYSFPFEATTGIAAPVFVNIPASVNRYRIAGAGHRFAHGGGSLQELVVPVLESTRKREEAVERVGLTVLNLARLRVVASRMRLDLFQEEPVGPDFKARTIAVGLYHPASGELLSAEERLDLNATASAPSERTRSVDLTLGVHSGSLATVKLKIIDVEDPLNPIEDHLIINNTLIEPDF